MFSGHSGVKLEFSNCSVRRCPATGRRRQGLQVQAGPASPQRAAPRPAAGGSLRALAGCSGARWEAASIRPAGGAVPLLWAPLCRPGRASCRPGSLGSCQLRSAPPASFLFIRSVRAAARREGTSGPPSVLPVSNGRSPGRSR